jgi:hypothetical protein
MKMTDLEKNGYFIEYKEDKEHWTKRINNLFPGGILVNDAQIVLLVGNKPHRFRIVGIDFIHSIPEQYAKTINTEHTYAIRCVKLEGAD